MLLSQSLAGFTKGQADTLRKAMGKKMKDVMSKMKNLFIEGGKEKGRNEQKLEKIWADWEAFAEYAFNKSHSTCYSYLAYQTAWLKANYPAEYMAAVLSRNLSNISEITKFMDECKRMGISVLGPNVNESGYKFTVNAAGNIRFGMAAVKNVGTAAVENIIEERKNGQYSDIFNFVERVNLTSVNKKNIESLVMSGAFDDLNIKRTQFLNVNAKNEVFLDTLIRYCSKMQADKAMNANSLFGGINGVEIAKPEIPPVKSDLSNSELLNREKELIGIYLSANPLDDYRFEMENLVTHTLSELSDLDSLYGKDITLGGKVSVAKESISKAGKPWASFTLEDYSGSHEFRLFGKDYEAFMKYLQTGYFLFIKAAVREKFDFAKKSSVPKSLEVKIKSISLLGNAKDEILKSITVTLPVSEITQDFVTDIKSILASNIGMVEFRIKLIDKEESLSAELFSRKFRISVNDVIIDYIKNNGLQYNIN